MILYSDSLPPQTLHSWFLPGISFHCLLFNIEILWCSMIGFSLFILLCLLGHFKHFYSSTRWLLNLNFQIWPLSDLTSNLKIYMLPIWNSLSLLPTFTSSYYLLTVLSSLQSPSWNLMCPFLHPLLNIKLVSKKKEGYMQTTF